MHFWMGAAYSGLGFFVQKLMDKRALQNGCFFHKFCGVYYCPCCCVIILPLFICWDILRCESEPLPSYKKLSNWSYLIFHTIQCSLFRSSSISVWLGTWYWSHRLRNLLGPSTRSAPVQNFYIGVPAIYFSISACRLLTYSCIGQNLMVSNSV